MVLMFIVICGVASCCLFICGVSVGIIVHYHKQARSGKSSSSEEIESTLALSPGKDLRQNISPMSATSVKEQTSVTATHTQITQCSEGQEGRPATGFEIPRVLSGHGMSIQEQDA